MPPKSIAFVAADTPEAQEASQRLSQRYRPAPPEKAEIILRASNPRYPDLVVNAQDVKVAGIFRGLIRHATP